jgi:hypothetical protein
VERGASLSVLRTTYLRESLTRGEASLYMYNIENVLVRLGGLYSAAIPKAGTQHRVSRWIEGQC